MGNKISKIYVGTHKVRPVEPQLMSLSDINSQDKFNVTRTGNLVTVSGNNPIQYGYSSSVRYWNGESKKTFTLPTKGELYIDGIFGPHNYDGESFFGIHNGTHAIGWGQYSITASTSDPGAEYPGTRIHPTAVNFMNNNRYVFRAVWDNGVMNQRIGNTQIITNASFTTSDSGWRFEVLGGRISSNGAINTKSLYGFYVKDLS